VEVACGDRKPCNTHDSERVKTRQFVTRKEKTCSCKGTPCLLVWGHAFSVGHVDSVLCGDRYDLVMTWERHASVLRVFYKGFGDIRSKIRSKLEVRMNVSYADFYDVYVYLQYSVPSCQTCRAFSSQGVMHARGAGAKRPDVQLE
jgi:hypothetical protein